jgi:hypothetical protein
MTVLSGCEPQYPANPQADNQTTNVAFINALPDDSTVTFEVDNAPVTNSSNMVTGSWSGYAAITLGPSVISAVSPSTGLTISTTSGVFPYAISQSSYIQLTSTSGSATLAMESNPTLFPGGYFTVIAQGSTVKARTKLVLVDVLTAPTGTNANVRLINAIPSGVSAGLSYTTTNAGIIASRAFNASASSVQSFTGVNPSKTIYLLSVLTTGGVKAIIDSVPSGSLSTGSIYTIIAAKKNGVLKLERFQNQ